MKFGHKIHTLKFCVEFEIAIQQFTIIDHFEKMMHDAKNATSMVKKRETHGHFHGKK